MADDDRINDLLTVSEIATTLKVNPQTVRNWIDRGELPALRVGGRRVRVHRSALEGFIGLDPESRKQEGSREDVAVRLTEQELDEAAEVLDQIAEGLSKLSAIFRGGKSA